MEPIEKTSITDQVVTSLKNHITSNGLVVGDKLPTEATLCKMLQVSRTTVREAIRILQALGYVEVRHGRGVFVAHKSDIGSEDLENWYRNHELQVADIMDVRLAIEPLSTRLAIERGTEKEIQELERIHAAYEKAYEDDDQAALCAKSELFHNKIIEMTHNQMLVGINKKIADAFIEYRCRGYSRKKSRTLAAKFHRDIMNSFLSKDKEKGEKVMTQHLNSVVEVIHELVTAEKKR